MEKSEIIYCTYFDRGFLLKGLALHSSLIRSNPDAKLWVLAFDKYTEKILERMRLKGMTVIGLADFEDNELLAVKPTRQPVEYYWTCTPSWILYVLRKNKRAKYVVYLDADEYFFSSPTPGVEEIGKKSLLAVEHRFPKGREGLNKQDGRFNVAFNVFKKDKIGIKCLRRWRLQCLEWCYWRYEDGKLGDQLYLNEWPRLYRKNLVISKNVGVNLAPFNFSQYKISKVGSDVFVNDQKLINYHFHQFQIIGPSRFSRTLGYGLSKEAIQNIYEPYEQELEKQYGVVKSYDRNFKITKTKGDEKMLFRQKLARYFGPTYWRIKGILQRLEKGGNYESSDKMRILQVIPYFWPALSFGGPVKVVYELGKELSKKHHVTVYTSDALDRERRVRGEEEVKSQPNFQVFYFPNLFNPLGFWPRYYTNFGIVSAYFENRNEFDIIHISDIFSLPQIFLTFIARFYHKPYIVSSHGVDVSGKIRNFFLKSMMYKIFVKGMLSEAKCIIATSVEESIILKNLGYKNVKVVYNGLSDKRVEPSTRFSKYKKSGMFTLLYIGRLNFLKGLDILIDSMKDFSFPFQILIAGPDDGAKKGLREAVKNYNLQGKVHFLGFVNEPEKEELYRISDIFVYPSRLEGFPIAILEALQHSLPVIITEACNFPDVRKYKTGFIAKGTELKEILKKHIVFDEENRTLLKEMGKNGRALVLNHYSISAMARNTLKLYEIYS